MNKRVNCQHPTLQIPGGLLGRMEARAGATLAPALELLSRRELQLAAREAGVKARPPNPCVSCVRVFKLCAPCKAVPCRTAGRSTGRAVLKRWAVQANGPSQQMIAELVRCPDPAPLL